MPTKKKVAVAKSTAPPIEVMLLKDIWPLIGKRDEKRLYGKAGDMVRVVSEHGLVLIVEGSEYVLLNKTTWVKAGERRHRFPVEASETNYLNKDAEIIVAAPEPVDDKPKQRPSYYAKPKKKKY